MATRPMATRPMASRRRPRASAPARAAALAATLATLAAQACQTPQWPLRAPPGSPFGVRVLGGGADLHRGLDLSAPVGTPVRPILSGRVRFAGAMSGYGNVIWIDHGEHLMSVYAHLSQISVQAAQEVSKSTVIGLTGESGAVTSPHLHLEIWRWGREIDPVQLMGRPPGG